METDDNGKHHKEGRVFVVGIDGEPHRAYKYIEDVLEHILDEFEDETFSTASIDSVILEE